MPANLKYQDALLAVSLCPRLGFKQFAVLQGLLPNIEELFYLKRSELRRLPLSAAQAEFIASTDWSQVTQIKSRCQSFGAEITGITDEHYPQQLKHIPQPPPILFTNVLIAPSAIPDPCAFGVIPKTVCPSDKLRFVDEILVCTTFCPDAPITNLLSI